jgi:hypothetical protein
MSTVYMPLPLPLLGASVAPAPGLLHVPLPHAVREVIVTMTQSAAG